MMKTRLVPLLLALVLLGCPSIGSAIEVNDPRQWQVKYTARVLPRTPYELHNLRRRELDLTSQLGFKEGPRLKPDTIDWMGHSGGHFEFHRENRRDHRTIKDDERLALYNTKTRRYLYWDNEGKIKEWKWSDSPDYQWMVHTQGPAPAGQFNVDFSLYNINRRTYLVLGPTGTYLTFLARGR